MQTQLEVIIWEIAKAVQRKTDPSNCSLILVTIDAQKMHPHESFQIKPITYPPDYIYAIRTVTKLEFG